MRRVLLAASFCLLPGAARAQTPDPLGAQAEALFERGRALAASGAWDAACEKFRASVALEPTASSAIKVARCDERAGKVASAWYGYQTAKKLNLRSRPGHREELEGVLEAAMAALRPRVPKLTVTVASRPAGLVVRKNGVVLPAAALGEPLPEDPGTVSLEAEAPGYVTATARREVREGQAVEVRLALEPVPVLRERRFDARIQPYAGLVLTGLGGGALLAAGGLGLGALAKVSASNPSCTPDNACLADGLLLRREASRYQDLGAALAIAGGVTVTVGLVLTLTAPTKEKPR